MTEEQTPEKRGGCLKGCLTVVLLLILIVAILGGLGWWKWNARPGYFDVYHSMLDRTTPQQRKVMARELTSNVTSTLSESGNKSIDEPLPDEGPNIFGAGSAPDPSIRLLTITVDEANAWVEQQLTGWLKNQGVSIPPQIKELAVGLDGDLIMIGCLFEDQDVTQWFSVGLKVKIERGGALARVRVDQTLAGSLPVPIAWILGYFDIEPFAGKHAAKVQDALGKGFEFEPVKTMPGNSHRVRVIGYDIEEDQVILKLKILQPDEPEEPDESEADSSDPKSPPNADAEKSKTPKAKP